MSPLIELRDVTAGYGELAVLRDVSVHVDGGEVVALIGPNGAGKTTTLLTLAGELTPRQGEVWWKGRPTSAPMHIRCRDGLGYLTEERSVIMDLTARENLRLAGVSTDGAVELFPQLEPLLRRKAGLLSGGEQQMLSLARALGRRPEVLLADELSLGLAPLVVDRLLAALRTAADDQGIGVLVVEQHVRKALEIADRVYVLDRGAIGRSLTAAAAREQIDAIEESYLTGRPDATD